MSMADVSGILPRGGTVLGTTNRDNPFHYAAGEDAAGNVIYEDRRDDVVRNLNAHGIECLIVIGGDGSLKIGYDLHRFCGVNVVGVPKTIDNDLPGTERTFGFDTAMAMATEALDRFIPRQNPITASWSLKSWGAMRGGLPFIPALPAERM